MTGPRRHVARLVFNQPLLVTPDATELFASGLADCLALNPRPSSTPAAFAGGLLRRLANAAAMTVAKADAKDATQATSVASNWAIIIDELNQKAAAEQPGFVIPEPSFW